MEDETLNTLKVYMQVADEFVEHATKEQLAECARILALNVAHYASRCGELPIAEHLDFRHATELGEEQAQMAIKGMEVFVGVLGNMGDEEPRQ
jgi:hypothetical protein